MKCAADIKRDIEKIYLELSKLYELCLPGISNNENLGVLMVISPYIFLLGL